MNKKYIIPGLIIIALLVSGCQDIGDRYRPTSFGNTQEDLAMIDHITEQYGDLTARGEPRFLELTMTDNLVNFIPMTSVSKYSKDLNEFNVWFVYDNFNNDVIFVEWKYLETDEIIHTFESQTGENFGRASFVLEAPVDGWPLGQYEVTVSGRGIEEKINFEVIDGPTVSRPLEFIDIDVDIDPGLVEESQSIEGTWKINRLVEGGETTNYPDDYGYQQYLQFDDGTYYNFFESDSGVDLELTLPYTVIMDEIIIEDFDPLPGTFEIVGNEIYMEFNDRDFGLIIVEGVRSNRNFVAEINLDDEGHLQDYDVQETTTPPPTQQSSNCLSGALSTSAVGSIWNPKPIPAGEEISAVISKGPISNKNFAVEVEPGRQYTIEIWDFDADFDGLTDFARKINLAATEGMYGDFIIEEEFDETETAFSITATSSTGCLYPYIQSYASSNREVPFKIKVS